ncbi:hypothetical protein GA0070607_1071 [Micromonospora coriariae]|uniref:Uncharacterized protein n=1 Tax=Micromonospora coriariae TaxID=285665 RepID=A0A1C4USK9_9ACTN|nr:hypothetical protein [Micromonospora coriariae]SCE74648.1 hypothetical protein GA0070607_1071 [Micromonospora coriariae]
MQTVGVPATANRPGLLRIVLVWLAGNLVIGLLTIVLIAAVDTLTYYIRAINGDEVVAPYGRDGARFAVFEIAVMGTVLLVAVVLFNRRQWRRFRAVRFVGSLPLLAATVVALALPFLWFWFGTDHSF